MNIESMLRVALGELTDTVAGVLSDNEVSSPHAVEALRRLVAQAVIVLSDSSPPTATARAVAAALSPHSATESLQVWGHASEEDAEGWHGAGATREEAIAAGRSEYEGTHFYVVRGRWCTASEYMPDADEILESAIQRAADNEGGENEWEPDASEEAKQELENFLVAWADKHVGRCSFWTFDGTPERIEPLAIAPTDPAMPAAEATP